MENSAMTDEEYGSDRRYCTECGNDITNEVQIWVKSTGKVYCEHCDEEMRYDAKYLITGRKIPRDRTLRGV